MARVMGTTQKAILIKASVHLKQASELMFLTVKERIHDEEERQTLQQLIDAWMLTAAQMDTLLEEPTPKGHCGRNGI